MNSSAKFRGKQTAFIIGILSAGVILLAGCTMSSASKDIVPATDKVSIVGTSDTGIDGGINFADFASNDCLFGACLGGNGIGTSSTSLQRGLGAYVGAEGSSEDEDYSGSSPGRIHENLTYLDGQNIERFYLPSDVNTLGGLMAGARPPEGDELEALIASFTDSDLSCQGFATASIAVMTARASVHRCQLTELQREDALSKDLLTAPVGDAEKKLKIRIINQSAPANNRSVFIHLSARRLEINACSDLEPSRPFRQEKVYLRNSLEPSNAHARELVSASTQLSRDGRQVYELLFSRPVVEVNGQFKMQTNTAYHLRSKSYVLPIEVPDSAVLPPVLEGSLLNWTIDQGVSGSGRLVENTQTRVSGIVGTIPTEPGTDFGRSSVTAIVAESIQSLPGRLAFQNFDRISISGGIGSPSFVDLIAYQASSSTSPVLVPFAVGAGTSITWNWGGTPQFELTPEVPSVDQVNATIAETMLALVENREDAESVSNLSSLEAFDCQDSSYIQVATIHTDSPAFTKAREACEVELTSDSFEPVNPCFSNPQVNRARAAVQNYHHGSLPTPGDNNSPMASGAAQAAPVGGAAQQ